MCPSLIEIGSKTAEKNSAQTNRHTDKQTDTTKIMVTWPWTKKVWFCRASLCYTEYTAERRRDVTVGWLLCTESWRRLAPASPSSQCWASFHTRRHSRAASVRWAFERIEIRLSVRRLFSSTDGPLDYIGYRSRGLKDIYNVDDSRVLTSCE